MLGNLKAVERLLKKTPNLEIVDCEGNTPLCLAAFCDNEKVTPKNKTAIVKLLINAGASANVANHQKYTPLYYAVKSNNKEMVEEIVKKTSLEYISLPNHLQETPEMVAQNFGYENIVKILNDATNKNYTTKKVKLNKPFENSLKSQFQSAGSAFGLIKRHDNAFAQNSDQQIQIKEQPSPNKITIKIPPRNTPKIPIKGQSEKMQTEDYVQQNNLGRMDIEDTKMMGEKSCNMHQVQDLSSDELQ